MKHMDFQYSSDFILYNLDDLEDAITCGEGGRGEVGGNEIMGFLKLTAFVCLQNQNVLKGKAVVGGFLIQSLGSAWSDFENKGSDNDDDGEEKGDL